MTSDKTRVLCLIAFALTASGCVSESDNISDSPGTNNITINVPEMSDDDAVNVDGGSTPELTDSTDISDGTATPVSPVSSAQMDAFIRNALLSDIPAELDGSTLTAIPGNFISNPLMN